MLDKNEQMKLIGDYVNVLVKVAMYASKANALEETLSSLGVPHKKFDMGTLFGADKDLIVEQMTILHAWGIYKKYNAAKADIEEIFAIIAEALQNGLTHEDMAKELKEKIDMDCKIHNDTDDDADTKA